MLVLSICVVTYCLVHIFFADEPKSIGLYLLNAGHKQVHISVINSIVMSFVLFLQFLCTVDSLCIQIVMPQELRYWWSNWGCSFFGNWLCSTTSFDFSTFYLKICLQTLTGNSKQLYGEHKKPSLYSWLLIYGLQFDHQYLFSQLNHFYLNSE